MPARSHSPLPGRSVSWAISRDMDSLRRGAAASDAVIHCAYSHDFSKPEEIGRMEAGAITALGSALAGTDRPLVITSVTGMGAKAPGQPATEDGYNPHNPRSTTEQAGEAVAERGVNLSIVRLAQVHNEFRQGFVSELVEMARAKGVSAYVGDGANRWSAVHLRDAVHLYRLAMERAEAGSVYHASAEEGIRLRDIAETIGKVLNVPVGSISSGDAGTHFGWLGMFAGMDMAASSAQTQRLLGWKPLGPACCTTLSRQDDRPVGMARPPASRTIDNHAAAHLSCSTTNEANA